MPLTPRLFAEAEDRNQRYEQFFRAQDFLGDRINEILEEYNDKMKVRHGSEQNLSLLVVAALGKGMKTFQAITRLCLIGYGEDALGLLRSNINRLFPGGVTRM